MAWLSELEPDVETEAASETEPAAVSTGEEDYTWLNQGDEAETAEPIAAEAAVIASVVSDDDDWLSELENAATETEAVTEPVAADASAGASAGEEDLSWLAADEVSDNELEEALQPAAASEDMGWLSEFEPEDAAVVAGVAAAAAVASNEPDVPMDDEEAIAAEADAFAESDEAAAVLDEHEAALEPTPAVNAPDWLNAMVPGLDVDYEAAEDEWIEDEEAAFDASEREYAWVDQMVEEEMAEVAYAGFSFSHPPAWLASGDAPSQPSAADDDLPDWISDDADADVPSWLR